MFDSVPTVHSSVIRLCLWAAALHAAMPVAAHGAVCDGASLDASIQLSAVVHDSFSQTFRLPQGAVSASQGTVHIRLQTCAGDLSAVRLRVWDDRYDQETWLDMAQDLSGSDSQLGDLSYWGVDLPIPQDPTVLYYLFELNDDAGGEQALAWYVDDDTQFYGGGTGEAVERWDDSRSFQVSVYASDLEVPEWAVGAVIYQIFPDRFRNGEPSDDQEQEDTWFYGETPSYMDWSDWGDLPPEECLGADMERAVCFFGGDLLGVTEKLGYLADLGVDAIYLNPVFHSVTNHRYDPQDYFRIDQQLGGEDAFSELVAGADQLGLKLILDGVFNHMSADSQYFDLYSRYDSKGQLTSPDAPGGNDYSGACESRHSSYRDMFFIPDIGTPARFSDGSLALCDGGTYEAWGGYFHIPKLDSSSELVRDLFLAQGTDSVGPYWISRGISGWRLDVAAQVDGGMGVEPGNTFWEDFRAALGSVDQQALVVGEEWDDASANLLGDEWHSVTNYRFRSAVLDWMFDSCSGDGCVPCSEYNCQGDAFQDAQSNPWMSGEINSISESLLDLRLKSIQEDYPSQAWKAAWNPLGSHDVNRILFLLQKISGDDADMARRKLIFASLFQFAYPGSPVIYYGDEVGLDAPGAWDGGTWQSDPYNRAPYPWADLGFSPDTELLSHFQLLGRMRDLFPVFRDGGVQTVLADDQARVYAFIRYGDLQDSALVVMNRRWDGEGATQDVNLDVADWLDDGLCMEDIFNGAAHVVQGGELLVGGVPDLDASILVPVEGDCWTEPDSGEAHLPSGAETGLGTDSGGGCSCASGTGALGWCWILAAAGILANRRSHPAICLEEKEQL